MEQEERRSKEDLSQTKRVAEKEPTSTRETAKRGAEDCRLEGEGTELEPEGERNRQSNQVVPGQAREPRGRTGRTNTGAGEKEKGGGQQKRQD